MTEGGAFKALTKYTGNHSEYHDWSFSARRVLARSDERFAGLLQWISGQIDEINESDVLEYRRTTNLSSADMDWLVAELYALLASKPSGMALGSIMSLEEVEVKGITGWQRLECEVRGYHRQRVVYPTESVTHLDRVSKVTDHPQAFYQWESSLKEFQRGRPAELEDDVKANAVRHMVDVQPQYRTFAEIRDYMLQQALQRADVYVGDLCHPTEKVGTGTPRVSTNTNTPTATKVTAPVPMDVFQMTWNVWRTETAEQEHDSCQYEQDQEYDGDELFAVNCEGKSSLKGKCFQCGMRGHKADRCWQKDKGKGGRRDSETGKGWPKGKWSNSGYVWDSNWHGKTYGLEVDPVTAVEPLPYLCAVSLNSSCEEFSEPKRMARGRHTKISKSGSSKDFAHVKKILDS